MERMMGVEPTLPAWEAEVLPMNYIRVQVKYITTAEKIQQENCEAGAELRSRRIHCAIEKTAGVRRFLYRMT